MFGLVNKRLFSIFCHCETKTQCPPTISTLACCVQGAPGLPGLHGRDGAKGDQGAAGAPGDKGSTGPEGPRGVQGKRGTKGTHGHQGTKGAKGAHGAQGAKGEPGSQAMQKNWKQCAWNRINDGKDNGLIKVNLITLVEVVLVLHLCIDHLLQDIFQHNEIK